MKPFSTFLAVLSFSFMTAQYNVATVYLNDSTQLKGLVKIKSYGGIKFKLDTDSKATSYDYNHIYGFDTKTEKYRYLKDKNEFPKLLKERLVGKFILYSDEIYNAVHMVHNGYGGAGGVGMMMGGGHATIYYIKKNSETIKIGTKFSKKQLAIFNDCPVLFEKIKSKAFKKREVYEIVEFYNKKCS